MLLTQSYLGERYEGLPPFKQIFFFPFSFRVLITLLSILVHTYGEKVAEVQKNKRCHTFVGRQAVHGTYGSRREIYFQIPSSACLNLLPILRGTPFAVVRRLLKAGATAGAAAAAAAAWLTGEGRCSPSEGGTGSVGCDGVASGVRQAGARPRIFWVSIFLIRVIRWRGDGSPWVVMQRSFDFSVMCILHGGFRCVFVIRHI